MSFKKLFLVFFIAISVAIANVVYNSYTVAENQSKIKELTNEVYPYINKTESV